MFKNVIRLLLACAFILVAPELSMAKRQSINLTPEQSAAVDEVETYFNAFISLSGKFTQLGHSGNITAGDLLISKPGKMRFEYAPPNPYVVISDGTWVAIVNRKKQSADQYPLSTTPLRLLLGQKMDLRKDAYILAADLQDGLVTLRLQDRDQFVAGELVLIYDSNNFALRQWIVVDGQGKRTTISLDNISLNTAVSADLFRINIKRSRPGKNQ
jgi:outer membrane lipoprotein-sorting protein